MDGKQQIMNEKVRKRTVKAIDIGMDKFMVRDWKLSLGDPLVTYPWMYFVMHGFFVDSF